MRKFLLMSCLVMTTMVSPAGARDTTLHLDSKDVLDPSYSKGTLDGSVRFYFAGQQSPAIMAEFGEAVTSRKTNGVGKSDVEACKWVMLSALLALQEQAKTLGANAVVGITSNFNQKTYVSATQFECHAGAIMAGVALKGTYAKVNDR